MATGNPDPVETWAPLFTKSFSDSQLLDPAYMLATPENGRRFCKLCNDYTLDLADKHVARHTRELAAWRKKRRAASEETAAERAAERRAEKELERQTLGTGIPESRRLANRVTSARYKLNHPEKHGREKWDKRELAELHKTLEGAVAALEQHRKKGKS